MVLESLESETPNIKDLSLEEQGKKETFEFDPEQELTERDWESLSDLMRIIRERDWGQDKSQKWSSLLACAGSLNFINSDRFKAESLITDGDWNDIFYTAKTARYDKRYSFVSMACNIKQLSHELYKQLDVNDELWRELHHDYARKQDEIIFRLQTLVNMRILYPDIPISEYYDEKELYQQSIKRLQEIDATKLMHFAPMLMANIHLLFPDKPCGLDPQMWQYLHNSLKTSGSFSFLEDSPNKFLDIVFAMKILSADHVDFTDQGMKPIYEKSVLATSETPPPLPEQRSF